MKKIIFILILLCAGNKFYAQELVNGNFSLTCIPPYDNGVDCPNTGQWGAIPGCQDGLQFGVYRQFNTSCLANWFITNGTPSISANPTGNFAHLQTFSMHDVGGLTSTIIETDPGSVGIAAHYPFLKGGCYTIQLDVKNLTSTCKKGSTILQLWAANGLIENSPGCTSPHPSTSGFQLITSISPGIENITGLLPLISFTADADFDQIMIFVDEPNPCKINIPLCFTPDHTILNTFGRLEVNLKSVTITPCANSCKSDMLVVNKSTQISSGGFFEHSLIEAGSSAEPGATPSSVVDAPNDASVIFAADLTSVRPNFKSTPNINNFFEIFPATGCGPCELVTPIQVPPGTPLSLLLDPEVDFGSDCDLPVSDATPGGTWSTSDPTTAVIQYIIGTGYTVHFLVAGSVTVMYKVGNCSATLKVVSNTPCAKKQNKVSSRESNDSFASNITIYPNPTQNVINVTAPCIGNGQVNILVKDVAGSTIYTESVYCDDHSSQFEHQVNMSEFPAGVYFVDVAYNTQHVIKKIVKL